MKRPTLALAATAALLRMLGGPAHAQEKIGGRDESWWREGAESREQQVAALEQVVADCEKTEAPDDGGVVEGYGIGRIHGRPVLVPLKRCDDERARLEGARGELERFEDEARRSGVPPGWLRD
jgi:hypothetical protein